MGYIKLLAVLNSLIIHSTMTFCLVAPGTLKMEVFVHNAVTSRRKSFRTLMLTEITLLLISSLSMADSTDRTPLLESMWKFLVYLSGDTKKKHLNGL